MNLFFRLFYTYFASRFRGSVQILDSCRTPFICLPSDLDVLGHMNNGKYFSLMDLARVDLMSRAGLLQKLTEKGWYPVVVAETMRFKKSIAPFDKFMIETVVLGWDEKAFILRQRFLKKENLAAEAVVRARFLKKTGGSVLTEEILALAEVSTPSPLLDPWIKDWNQFQSQILN